MIVLSGLVVCALFAVATVTAALHPRLALIAWLLVLTCVPYWLSVRVGLSWTPAAVISLPLVAAGLAWSGPWRRRTMGDWLVASFFVVCLIAWKLGGAPNNFASALVYAFLAYRVGRFAVPAAGFDWTRRVVVAVLLGVASWAVIERLIDWHPFVRLGLGRPEAFWAPVAVRAGHVRSEAAFGHPIALGACLALAVPLILSLDMRTGRKIMCLALIVAGVIATASRGPLLGTALAIVLVVVFGARRTNASTRIVVAVVTIAVAAPIVSSLTTSFNSDEDVAVSSSIRANLYSNVLNDFRPLGLAVNVQTDPSGQFTYRGLPSIDSTFLQIGLIYGWLPMVLAALGLLSVVARVLRFDATIEEIVLVSQIPVFATVALITQYQFFVLFFVGWVVAERAVLAAQAAAPAIAARQAEPGPALRRSAQPALTH